MYVVAVVYCFLSCRFLTSVSAPCFSRRFWRVSASLSIQIEEFPWGGVVCWWNAVRSNCTCSCIHIATRTFCVWRKQRALTSDILHVVNISFFSCTDLNSEAASHLTVAFVITAVHVRFVRLCCSCSPLSFTAEGLQGQRLGFVRLITPPLPPAPFPTLCHVAVSWTGWQICAVGDECLENWIGIITRKKKKDFSRPDESLMPLWLANSPSIRGMQGGKKVQLCNTLVETGVEPVSSWSDY